MTRRTRICSARRSFPLLLAGLALATLAGCPTPKQLAAMPGLADVTPTGPEGRRCYDFCAQAEVSCKHICPKGGQICADDCVRDTKLCLKDCPELQNHLSPPQ